MTSAVAIRDETGVAVQHSQVTEVQRIGGLLAASGYFSDAREMAQAAVKVLAGAELGIPPVAAMMGLYIVKGKIMLSGNLIASRIRAHGYNYIHKQFDSKGCVLEFVGKKGEPLGISSFTEEDAKTAGVLSDMYRKFPRNMYFNRAISNGAKWYTPEVFAGAPVYVAEELGQPIDEQGDYIVPDAKPAITPQQVAESKITQMKAGVPYAETKAVPLPIPESEQVPEPVKAMWAEMKNITTVCNVFSELKSRLADATGSDERYYFILTECGKVKHANELKQKAARTCAWKLYDAITEAEAALVPSEFNEPAYEDAQ